MAARTLFKKLHTDDADFNIFQSQLKATIDELTSSIGGQAQLVGPVTLKTGANLVSHGLDRKFVAALPCIPSAAATLNLGTSPDPSKFIAITASAPCSLYLWVF